MVCKVAFVMFGTYGSDRMTTQIVELLNERPGFEARVVHYGNRGAFALLDDPYATSADVIVVEWAPIPSQVIRSLKRGGEARVVYFPIDNFALRPPEVETFGWMHDFDWIITHTAAASDELVRRGNFRGRTANVHHHWDPRFLFPPPSGSGSSEEQQQPKAPADDELRLVFFGGVTHIGPNLCHARRLVEKHGARLVDTYAARDMTDEWLAADGQPDAALGVMIEDNIGPVRDLAHRFNCDVSFREPNTVMAMHKPATKISTAAVLGHAILVSRDASAVELLGDDYPLFLDENTPEAVDRLVERAKEAFADRREAGGRWAGIMERMRVVRERTSPEAVTDRWVEMLTEISAAAPKATDEKE